MPGLENQIVAAGHGQALAAPQHMVLGVAAAGHPECAVAGLQPGRLWSQPALRIVHQYLFHDKLPFVPKSKRDHRCLSRCCRMKSRPLINTNPS
jgi:hypothetical protein